MAHVTELVVNCVRWEALVVHFDFTTLYGPYNTRMDTQASHSIIIGFSVVQRRRQSS